MASLEARWRRAAAYAVCRDDAGRMLLTRFASPGHPDHGGWTLPGGALEWGESAAKAAVREVDEETGLIVVLGSVLGVFSRWYSPEEAASGEAGHVVGIVHHAEVVSGDLRTSWEPGTTDAAAWFTPDEIRDLPRVELLDFTLDLL